LVPFIDQLITPIAAVDARRGSQLLETLRTFVDHNGSIQETADARFLHVNTVRHRLATVRKLVGRNPLDHGDLVSLEIALWAFERGQRHNR
jgi:DNA-binding PucR family transcriptional regulator